MTGGGDRPPNGTPSGRNRRKRVVLADNSQPVTVVRTLVDVEAQTSVGEALVRDLISAQLKTAVWLGAVVLLLLGALPVAGYLSPSFATATVAGVRLPWLLLGVLPFPLLFGVGYLYHWLAERHERDFVDTVES
ncbi:MAG: hypothetical protein ACRDRN_08560 [Sciscionella sp.]